MSDLEDKHNRENNDEAFRRYQEQMHGNDDQGDGRRAQPRPLRMIFGIFMIIVYIGMGVLCITNWFGYPDNTGWSVARWIVGVVLIIYGIWRAYRQFAGIDSRF